MRTEAPSGIKSKRLNEALNTFGFVASASIWKDLTRLTRQARPRWNISKRSAHENTTTCTLKSSSVMVNVARLINNIMRMRRQPYRDSRPSRVFTYRHRDRSPKRPKQAHRRDRAGAGVRRADSPSSRRYRSEHPRTCHRTTNAHS